MSPGPVSYTHLDVYKRQVLHGTMNSSDALYHKEDKNLDDFREWLSDNLRYFMLGGAILIIVLVLFFGVRACVGSNKGNSGDGQKTAACLLYTSRCV